MTPQVRAALLLCFVFVVIAACVVIPVPSATTWGTLSVVTVVGGFRLSSRHAIFAPVAAALLVVLGLLASQRVATAVLLITCYGAATAISQRWRLLPIAAAIGSLIALATVSPPPLTSGTDIALIAVNVLVPGLLVAIAARLLVGVGGGDGVPPMSWWGIRRSVVVIVPILFLLSIVLIALVPSARAWWALLTFFVVLVPTAGLTYRKIGARVGGTLIGGVATAVAVVVLPSVWVTSALCFVTLVLTVYMNLTNRYLLYSLFLTMTIMFAAHDTTESTLALDSLRVGATVLGALVAALVVWLIENLTRNPPITGSS